MTKSVHEINFKALGVLLMAAFLSFSGFSQNYSSIPEFVFKNPVLVSGKPNQDGAVYRFNNIATGYDATVTILGRSAANVVLDTIDLSPSSGYGMGYDKALQPQLGIKGNVPAKSSWWMKFQVDFLQAGTNKAATISKFYATAIDVDGDGVSIKENVQANSAISASYNNPTYLIQNPLVAITCPQCHKLSLPIVCPNCLGLGYYLNGGGKQKLCTNCNGSGRVFALCNHPFTGEDMSVQGPVDNAAGIDTSASGNMVTFVYNNVSTMTFQYGGTSGTTVSNAGERLNSMYFKAFSLSNPSPLPVKLTSFNALLVDQKNVLLNWTASQEGLDYFSIERSQNGVDYSNIAVVFPTGNSGQLASYSYTDKNVISSSGAAFYRIRYVEKSKEATYSDVRTIKLNGNAQQSLVLSTYPNPVRDEANITLPAAWQGKAVKLELYSISGVQLQAIQLSNASQTQSMQVGSLSKGVYLVKATCENQTAQQRIVKN